MCDCPAVGWKVDGTRPFQAPQPHFQLCRLWQLQAKMAAVGGGSAYEARLERVAEARSGVEQRLQVRG